MTQFDNDSSSSSGRFDDFLSKIKPAIKPDRYRLSTGSLSDFIVNSSSSNNNSSPDLQSYGLKSRSIQSCQKPRLLTKVLSTKCKTSIKKRHNPCKSVATPKHVVVFSSDSDDVFQPLTSVKTKNASNKHKKSLDHLSFTDSDKENQTYLPLKEPQILRFSTADSDNDSDIAFPEIVPFATVTSASSTADIKKKASKETPDSKDVNLGFLADSISPLAFASKGLDLINIGIHKTSSSLEPKKKELWTLESSSKEKSSLAYREPKTDRFSDSENDNGVQVVAHLPKPTFSFPTAVNSEIVSKPILISDYEDEDFVPLKDRILTPKLINEKLDRLNIPKPPSSVRPKKKQFLTPQTKPILKPFHTEKVNHTKLSTCSIKNCFLSSLDSFAHQNSGPLFKKGRKELADRLFTFFNATVFEHQLPETLEVQWSNRLTKTAGVTKCKRKIESYRDDMGKTISVQTRTATITLSEKIIDSANRLRDTLIHEICHAAVWLINNSNESHGRFWKSWAAKAQHVHPELPSIERCHNYDIDYKYRYQCTRYCIDFICELLSGQYYHRLFIKWTRNRRAEKMRRALRKKVCFCCEDFFAVTRVRLI